MVLTDTKVYGSLKVTGETNVDNIKTGGDLAVLKSINFGSGGLGSYSIGDTGPGGGIVFYDAGSVQTSTYLNSSGTSVSYNWRYMECSPSNILMTVSGSTMNPIWGGCTYTADSWSWDPVSNLSSRVGNGRYNTSKIVNQYGTNDYNYYDGNTNPKAGAGNYAARLCQNYNGGGLTDWYLPSIEELKFIYSNLKLNNLSSFTDSWYWSSSQMDRYDSWILVFGNGLLVNDTKDIRDFVRAVRGFVS